MQYLFVYELDNNDTVISNDMGTIVNKTEHSRPHLGRPTGNS